MNTSKGFFAHGLTLLFDSVEVKGITNIDLGGGERGDVEVTDNDSLGNREYVPGLRENGEITIECRYLPQDPGQIAMVANRNAASPTPVEIELTLPPGATVQGTELAYLTMQGYVKGGDTSLPTADETAASRTFVIKISGGITESQVSD